MKKNIWQNKTVLITGHTGFKGTWLSAWLTSLGARVVGVALAPETTPNHFDCLKSPIESHILDINDFEKLSVLCQKTNPDIIFHLAAQALVRDSYESPLQTLETNILGTANLLEIARSLSDLQAVLVVTSDKCYENKEWIWGYRENDPMGGYDPYSASKGCAELIVNSYRQSFFNLDQYSKKHHVLVASARAGNVIGGGDWARDRLIPDMVRAIAENKSVSIRNPNATRPWQHVLDCLHGYLLLAERLLQGDKAFAEGWNFAPTQDRELTVEEIVQKMQAGWSKLKYVVQKTAEQPHEAAALKLDVSKAERRLNFHSVLSIEENIAMTVEWYRRFYEDKKVITLSQIERYMQMENQK